MLAGKVLATIKGVPFHKGDFSISTYFQKIDQGNQQYLITNVYGPPYRKDQKLFFKKPSDLKKMVHSPWIILGDFNVTRCPEGMQERSLKLLLFKFGFQ